MVVVVVDNESLMPSTLHVWRHHAFASIFRWLPQADFLASPWHPRTTPGRCFEPELATTREMPSSRLPSVPHPQISRQADWHTTPLHAEPSFHRHRRPRCSSTLSTMTHSKHPYRPGNSSNAFYVYCHDNGVVRGSNWGGRGEITKRFDVRRRLVDDRRKRSEPSSSMSMHRDSIRSTLINYTLDNTILWQPT